MRKLCAKNDGIRAAVVSVETFALARPSTAASHCGSSKKWGPDGLRSDEPSSAWKAVTTCAKA